jgi:hypothetical protein
MKRNVGLLLGAVLALSTAQLASAQQSTALNLAKQGDNYVGAQSRDRILEIYSDKSVTGLEPNVWHVVYYNPDVFFKSTEVKFGGGQEMDVSYPMHPLHLFQMPAKPDQILNASRLNVDSDQALQIATSQPLLRGLTLRYSKLTLEKTYGVPTWKVELWAAKVNNPTEEAGVGSISISAIDRSIIDMGLHPANAGQ